MKKLRLCPLLALFVLLLTHAVPAWGAPRGTAADMVRLIDELALRLMAKHSVTERGDFGWLDSTDAGAVFDVEWEYEDFIDANGAAAATQVSNQMELQQMVLRVTAAMKEVQDLQTELLTILDGERLTKRNYSGAYINYVANLRARVEQMPMLAGDKQNMRSQMDVLEADVAGVQAELSALAGRLSALDPAGIRFDDTQGARALLTEYGTCSADAHTRMACRERVDSISARLAGLDGVQKEYDALLEGIPKESKEGAGVPYARKARLAELGTRYDALEPYVRGRLDAALGGGKQLFFAARKRIEERSQAVVEIRSAIETLPERESILNMNDEETTACRARVLAAKARYATLAEDAERAELGEWETRLEQALLATTRFTVTARGDSRGTATVAGSTYYGKECLIRVQPETGWRSVGITGAAGAVQTTDGWRFHVTGDATITVLFERIRYVVTASATCGDGDGCLLYGAVQAAETVEHGAGAVCGVRAEPSHKITSVTATMGGKPAELATETLPDGTERCTVENADGPVTFTARFEPRMLPVTTQCTLGGAPAECGSITAGKLVRWGGAFEGEVHALPGYRLAGVMAGEEPVPVGEDGRFVLYDIRMELAVSAVFETIETETGTGVKGGGGHSSGSSFGALWVVADEEAAREVGYRVELTPGQEKTETEPTAKREAQPVADTRDAVGEIVAPKMDAAETPAPPEPEGAQEPAQSPPVRETTRSSRAVLAAASVGLALALTVVGIRQRRRMR